MVRPIWQVAASEGAVIRKIQLLLAVVTLAALVASAMGIASLMTSTIMERSREIGLMKALDARPWQILLVFYADAVLAGLIGGALGCLAGWGVAQLMGLGVGGTVLMMTLAGSASYIAAPTAMRIAVPEANPALGVAAALAVTFPFNLLLGIPLYLWWAQTMAGA